MSDPDGFDLDDDLEVGSGVRRVNNVPLYIVIAVSVVFVLTMMLVMVHRSQNQLRQEKDELQKPSESTDLASQIVGPHRTGFIPSATPPLAMPEKLPPPTANATPAPPLPPAPSDTPAKDEKQAALEAELQELRSAKLEQTKAAISSKSQVALATGEIHKEGSLLAEQLDSIKREIDRNSLSSKDPIEHYQKTLNSLKAAGILPSQSGPGIANNVGSYQAFDSLDGANRLQLPTQLEPPETRYELRAGFVIPGTLIGGINSDSPGQIVAQVGQNVYDTATGRHLLIPLGSRLVGSYDSDIAYGQERLLVAWQRIILPDGKALDIGAMPGADSSGYSGFNDQTNHHFVRTFGSAFLMSAVIAATSLSQLNGNNAGGNNGQYYNQQTTAGALNQALGQQLGQVTAQMIAKNLNIAPTLEIRPGFRFNVVVTKDLAFNKPYQAFDYSLQE
ncbi:TrbI/VirB10 family protein [Methyloglobulus morosus]|uniref:TrbI/VirB10 family protein n=1 Tax=Methyloglobulus morosus TaxID=1410681 RepID=UPI001F31A610|nr:TrbI/VirB10 family protein [Methyloglobulus morosus]